MFLLSQQSINFIKHRIEVDTDVESDISTLDDFYMDPDAVSSYEFPNADETRTADNRLISVYKFLANLTDKEYSEIKKNLVDFSNDGNQNDFELADPALNAIVNLGEIALVRFYRRHPNPEETIESSEEITSPVEGVEPLSYISEPEIYDENTNLDDFIFFELEIENNQLFIYDPNIFQIQSDMTKYQYFGLY